jgi:hypothetical protein
MYADLPVGVGDVDNTLTAFGTDLMLREELPSEEEVESDEYDFE